MPTATAAAGVANFNNHSSIDSNAEFNLLTILGSAAKESEIKRRLKNIRKIKINKNFFLAIKSRPFFKIWIHVYFLRRHSFYAISKKS